MIGLLLPWHLNLGGGVTPPVDPAVVVRSVATVTPLVVSSVAEVVPDAEAVADALPLVTASVATVIK